MSNLGVAGLASGFDWKSLVSQLADVDRAPERVLQNDQNKIYQQNNAYAGIQTELTVLKSRITTLQSTDLYQSRQTSVSDTTVGQATAAAGTGVGNYGFNIAKLNSQIESSESRTGLSANDLRDTRQQKLEELGKLVNFDSSTGTSGGVNISVGGVALVTENVVSDRLQTYDPGSGALMLRAQSAGTALNPTSGSLAGTIAARDGGVAQLQSSINTLAGTLIQQVNLLHGPGYGLNGSSGTPFFTGSGSGDIQVSSTLMADPSLLQAAGAPGAAGDNQVARGIATLADQTQGALGGITFGQSYSTTVGAVGSSLASVTQSLADQKSVESLLGQQRSSVSGVSMDEELSDLTRFQKAYEASARLMSTVNSMLDTVVHLGL